MKVINFVCFWMLLFYCSIKFSVYSQSIKDKPYEIELWNNVEMPYKEHTPQGGERVRAGNRTSNINRPILYLYKAPNPNGVAIIACPGGAYEYISMDNEGHKMAAWMNQNGITFGVLKYRLPRGENKMSISDAERAIRILRDSANNFKINPNLIGIMGASAGGHLASTIATRPTSEFSRPNFQILLYPVISMKDTLTSKLTRKNFLGSNPSNENINSFSNEENVTSLTPPAFIVLSADDKSVVPANSLLYCMKLIEKGVKVTLHLYSNGKHGWGYNDSFKYKNEWKMELESWLKKEILEAQK